MRSGTPRPREEGRIDAPQIRTLHRLRSTTFVACGLSLVLAAGCNESPSADDPGLYRDCDILVVVVDALRADRLGPTSAGHDVSPNIDGLAADGVRFELAIAQSTFTGSSIASLFTGLYPHHHGLYWGTLTEGDTVSAHALSPAHHTLAERLSEHGYRTASWFQNRMLRAELGFGQGFEVYEEIRGDKRDGSRRIVNRYLSWLADRADEGPTFAYLHLLDLHEPYDPPPPFDTMFLSPGAVAPDCEWSNWTGWHSWSRQVRRGEREVSASELQWITSRYDGTVRSIDQQVGRLLRALRELGRYERTLIVVTADHGDGFLEHGSLGHSNEPYLEVVHVPLIVKLPGARVAGRTVAHQVRLVDLGPTLVEMATGGETDLSNGPDGCSLLPLLTAGPVDSRPGRCREAVSEMLVGGEHLAVAVRERGMSYIMGERLPPALYALASDPREQVDIAGRGLAAEARLRRRALEVLATARVAESERLIVDPETLEQIRALGYAR